MSIFHFVSELDLVNATVLAPIENDFVVYIEFLAFSDIGLFVNDASQLDAVVFLFHLDAVREPPELFMADEVIADFCACECWKACSFGLFVILLWTGFFQKSLYLFSL